MRPKGSAQELERRRHHAIALLQAGHLPVEVARRLGVNRRSVRLWKASYRQRGEAGIRARPHPGRPFKLDRRQRAQLRKLLVRGAKAAGFPNELWTCARVVQVIEKRWGVRYSPTHMSWLLRHLGFSLQRPQRRAGERNDARIQGWVQKEWPRIKKKPRGGTPGWSSSTRAR